MKYSTMKYPVMMLALLLAYGCQFARAQEPAGYLFAHMTKEDYGRLYYSLSQNGLQWQALNRGERIQDDYRGHPDIMKGVDGRYYLMGNRSGSRSPVTVWVSDDLLQWELLAEHMPDLHKTPDFHVAEEYMGAPKMFCDWEQGLYLITWHTPSYQGEKNFKTYWGSMRTLYMTTKDFKTFTDPKRLFPYDMATIDVIIRKEGKRYYAIMKDEQYPDFEWPTGKAIRIASSDNLLGPYSEPSGKITASFREAPTLIPAPGVDGYYLYYEKYPGLAYEMSTAPSLEGPWIDYYSPLFSIPEGTRHGCMIPLSQEEFDGLSARYGPFVPMEEKREE